MKNLIRSLFTLSIGLIVLVGIESCKKDAPLNSRQVTNLKNQSITSTHVSYNESYDVLVFNTFEDVEALYYEIEGIEESFPDDRGNKELIWSLIAQIERSGYTLNPMDESKVYLNDLEELIEQSHPICDATLHRLLQAYNNGALPGPFVRDVLRDNPGLSFDVYDAMEKSNLPNGLKQSIIQSDNAKPAADNFVYRDFLRGLPDYNSLWEKLWEEENDKLRAGIDPISPDFDNDFVQFDFERLMLNERREVYIENKLYKLYDSCRMVVIEASLPDAYAELDRLGPDGYIEPPVEYPEGKEGIPLAEMNSVFPTNYANVNQLIYHPDKNPVELYNSELDSKCAQSEFGFVQKNLVGTSFDVEFNNITRQLYPSGDYVQYWLFGDGTGSFQENPTHTYSSEGVYQAKLITFRKDCGCWDVREQTVNVLRSTCVASFDWTVDPSSPETITFTENGSYANPSSAINVVAWDFGDNSPFFSGNPVSHTYTSPGNYEVTITIEFANGCIAQQTLLVGVSTTSYCCDTRERIKNRDVDPYGDGQYRLKIVDKFRGIGFWILPTQKIKGKQKFYRKKNNGNWTGEKTSHQLEYIGEIKELDASGECGFPGPTDNANSCSNNKKCKVTSGSFSFDFGVEEDKLVFRHRVNENGYSPIFIVKLGSCD